MFYPHCLWSPKYCGNLGYTFRVFVERTQLLLTVFILFYFLAELRLFFKYILVAYVFSARRNASNESLFHIVKVICLLQMYHQVCPHFLFDLLPAAPSFVQSALFYWPPPAHQIHHMQSSSKAFTLVIFFLSWYLCGSLWTSCFWSSRLDQLQVSTHLLPAASSPSYTLYVNYLIFVSI